MFTQDPKCIVLYKLKFHIDQSLGRPCDKACKMFCRICIIFLVYLGFFFLFELVFLIIFLVFTKYK